VPSRCTSANKVRLETVEANNIKDLLILKDRMNYLFSPSFSKRHGISCGIKYHTKIYIRDL
ncbi:hypothetical protein SNEBB_002084, partial [Seison nebaliae]